MTEQTREARLLDEHEGLREQIAESAEFQTWREELPDVTIDGEKFYVLWGDRLMDEDQIMVIWARKHKLL